MLTAGIVHSWAVDPEYRRYSFNLYFSYRKQKNVHFLLTTSANRESSRVEEISKSFRVPITYYDDILLWILNYREFVAGALRYKSVPLASIAKYSLAAGVCCWDRICRAGRPLKSEVLVQLLDAFDERFDSFWKKLQRIPSKLRAVRNLKSLEWHCRYALRGNLLRIFAIERPEGISAYLLLLRSDLPQTGWHRYRIVDMQTLEPDANLVRSLLAVALQYAREKKAYLLESVGLSSFPRKILSELHPPHRHMTNWPAGIVPSSKLPDWILHRLRSWIFHYSTVMPRSGPIPRKPHDLSID